MRSGREKVSHQSNRRPRSRQERLGEETRERHTSSQSMGNGDGRRRGSRSALHWPQSSSSEMKRWTFHPRWENKWVIWIPHLCFRRRIWQDMSTENVKMEIQTQADWEHQRRPRSQTVDVRVGGLARYSLSGMLWLVVDVSCCCDVHFPSSSLFPVQKPMVSWLLFLPPPPSSLSLGSHSISGC